MPRLGAELPQMSTHINDQASISTEAVSGPDCCSASLAEERGHHLLTPAADSATWGNAGSAIALGASRLQIAPGERLTPSTRITQTSINTAQGGE
jgi:hypothetical protein